MSDRVARADREYLFEYFHDGAWWGCSVWASSREDAEARIKKMPLATYVGEIHAKIPGTAGWVAKVMVWWKNLTSRRPR